MRNRRVPWSVRLMATRVHSTTGGYVLTGICLFTGWGVPLVMSVVLSHFLSLVLYRKRERIPPTLVCCTSSPRCSRSIYMGVPTRIQEDCIQGVLPTPSPTDTGGLNTSRAVRLLLLRRRLSSNVSVLFNLSSTSDNEVVMNPHSIHDADTDNTITNFQNENLFSFFKNF